MNSDPEINQALLEANPLIAVLLMVFGLGLLILMSSFFLLWVTALRRWFCGDVILTVDPWKPRAWGLVDVLLVLAAAFVGQALMIPAWGKLSGVDLRKMVETDSISLPVMAVGSVSYLVAMLFGTMWLLARYNASFEHMGLSFKRILPNVGLGLAAAAMALPIVALVSAAVSLGLEAEYDHPLINELKKEGTLSAYLLAVFCAVVVAPLVEEYFFRVLLQGWLQSVPWSTSGWWWLLGSRGDQTAALMSETPIPATTEVMAIPAPAPASQTLPNPYEPPVLAGDAFMSGESPELVSAIRPDTKPPVWPALVVGTLFGLAHFDYGLSFIPLILLGIVLGLLYRAKHSIWPCFVLHFALNSFSMISLGITLLVEAAK